MRLSNVLVVLGFVGLGTIPAQAVPPPPHVLDAADRGKVDLEVFKRSHLEARSRGVDRPNPVYGPHNRPFGPQGAISRSVRNGAMNVLILLIDFSDNEHQTAASYFDSLGYAVNSFSLRYYYGEVSYGQMTIVTVDWPSYTGWQRAPHTYTYYVNGNYGWGSYPQNSQGMCEDLCSLVDPIVDFSDYDNDSDGIVDGLNIIYAGRFDGTPNTIWPHMWSLPWPGALHDGVRVQTYSVQNECESTPGDQSASTMCHEFGHILGLPDLYDYDYDSYGVGRWCLMSFGSHNGGGWSPSHPSAWCRISLGFASAVNVTADGWYQLPPVESSPGIYRLWREGEVSSQYFLVENRRPIGYDTALPSWGTLVWHVDDDVYGNDDQWYPGYTSSGHYHVALEQADGLWELERYLDAGDAGDPYPGSTGNRYFNVTTTPDSRDYQFNNTYCAVDSTPDSANEVSIYLRVGITSSIPPMALQISLVGSGTARISWSPVPGATQYEIYRSTSSYFQLSGPPWQTVAAPSTYLDFTEGVGNASVNYGFIGRARNAGAISVPSTTVGEFDFGTATSPWADHTYYDSGAYSERPSDYSR
jgi:immune inhibitor A